MPFEDSHTSSRGKNAESTHFRPGSAGAVDSVVPMSGDGFAKSKKSMRLHVRTVRGGLAARLALPIITAIIIGFAMVALVARDHVARFHNEDLQADAANAAFNSGMLGRLLLAHRTRFIEEHPDFLERAEWLTGDYWLLTHGFVRPDDWIEATGFQLDEYAPRQELERAGQRTILASLNRYLNSPGADTEIVAISLLDSDGVLLASAQKQAFRFPLQEVKNIPPPDDYHEVGGMRVSVDFIKNISSAPMVRGLVRIMDDVDPERIIGYAVVLLRTQRHTSDQNSFMLLLAVIGLILVILMAGVCWYSARQATAPMRRLVADMQAIAEGDYSRRAQVSDNDELGQLSQAFNSMAERLRLARMNEKETNRLESDLSIAKDIQNNLLPAQTPRVRGLDMYTAYRPAREIGGDYFDFLPVDEQHMGIVIADASGKSIPAALVMSTTRAILRFVAPGSVSAAETLTRVNAILSVDIPKGMFVTAYYMILDPLGGSMLCASAGHTPLLIARADGSVELLNPGGIALGFDTGPIFQRSIREQNVKLLRGDRVLLYTDGVVECVNTANEEYSDRRLREFLRRNRDLTSREFVGALMADLDRYRGAAEMRDDTTIVTFKVL